MTDSGASLYAKTTELLCQAVAADTLHRYSEALGLYNNALKSIAELQKQYTGHQRTQLESKFCEYSGRVSVLLQQLSDNPAYFGDLDKARVGLNAAHKQHLQGCVDAALDLYIGSIGCYQRILRQTKSAGSDSTKGKQWRRELLKFANTCLKEAEIAKQTAFPATAFSESAHSESPTLTASDAQSTLQLQMSGLSLQTNGEPDNTCRSEHTSTPESRRNSMHFTPQSQHLSPGTGSSNTSTSSTSNAHSSRDTMTNASPPYTNGTHTERLTEDETQVVRITSHINGLTFLPWLENDKSENFVMPSYFTDKDGLLTLSRKQQRKLWQWRRASHLYGHPQIFGQHGCGHIVQETVTDCSFVAALCVSVEYEHRFKRQLITQHVYPKGRNGMPEFNPAGKYMVKLFVNGLWRRVVIDDLLPVGETGKLLCTYSVTGDIGQSLMEKAFLKVMGGYDFPGSNASTDLHVLTGWIPEHVFVQDQAFDAERTWTRMHDGLEQGSVLLTIATGEMGSDVAASLGLVPSHAYAVLDAREVCGHQLLRVKNPWNSLRWTGAFSHADQISWTPDLMRALDYDPKTEHDDQGIFWIDFASVCHRFDAIHLNWNPRVFAHQASVHFSWNMDMGPRQALHDFSANPQYTLVAEHGTAEVWILLSKHLLKTEENVDFIALHVYDNTNGRRVYEPRAALHIGEYVNTQHVLVQLTARQGEKYTLVVAQREKTKPLHFTLRALSSTPVRLVQAPVPMYCEDVTGQWGSASAGGNTASPRYMDNPQFQITIPPNAPLTSGIITLETAHKHPVNIRVFRGGFLVTRVLEINTVATSGKYRSQFCTCELEALEPGSSYTVVVSTFEPFMFSRFKLRIGLGSLFTVAPIAREGAGMRMRELHGKWMPGSKCVGGPDQSYHKCPRFLVRTECETRVLARLQTPHAKSLPLVNVSVYEFDDAVLGTLCASSGSYTNSPQGVATRQSTIGRTGCEFLVVASAWDHDVDASFVLYFYSEHTVEVTPLFY
ncbi:cysteine protease [Coemansia sp. RSA 2523]|nr:cysteine protease [Coemansia sp. RSA 1824]KAJ1809504.1 cysteine protease [Coemansia sp. RSA 2523]